MVEFLLLFLWYIVGFITMYIAEVYVDKNDVTLEQLPFMIGASCFGPILFILIAVKYIEEYIKKNKGKIIFKAKSGQENEDNN